MTALICLHERQLAQCAVCIEEAEVHFKRDPNAHTGELYFASREGRWRGCSVAETAYRDEIAKLEYEEVEIPYPSELRGV